MVSRDCECQCRSLRSLACELEPEVPRPADVPDVPLIEEPEPDPLRPADDPDVPLAPEPAGDELVPEVPRPADVPDVPLIEEPAAETSCRAGGLVGAVAG